MPIRAVLASGFSIVGLACATAPGDAGREPGASTASAPAQALQGELGGEGPLDTDGLRRSLGKAKLAGFVRLSPTAKLHPTREAAAAAGAPVTTEQGKHAPTTRSGDLARVIEDLGAVVRISTELSRDAPLAPLDARFALEGFVRRDALMPVLTRAKAASMADGSGYALAPGLLAGRLHLIRMGREHFHEELFAPSSLEPAALDTDLRALDAA
jgi:hypothetical protein